MIELTWEQLDTKPFRTAVVAVNNSRDIDAKQAYRAGRICQVAHKEAEKIVKAKQEIAKKHGFDFEKGEFPSKDAEEACNGLVEQMLKDTKVQIKVLKLDWKQLFGKVKLSGLEMVHLQDICDNVPENEEEL